MDIRTSKPIESPKPFELMSTREYLRPQHRTVGSRMHPDLPHIQRNRHSLTKTWSLLSTVFASSSPVRQFLDYNTSTLSR